MIVTRNWININKIMKTYKIGNKEIKFDLPDGNYEKGIKEIFFGLTQLLESLDEKKEEYQECQWENCGGGRYCEKHSLETEPKSTLRELITEIVHKGEYNTDKQFADKIISLFKDTLLKEIDKSKKIGELQATGDRLDFNYTMDIKHIINNF